MDDIVGPLKAYLAKSDPSKIDNFVFRLHVRVTFALMMVCMCLVSKMSCVIEDFIDYFCLIGGSWSIYWNTNQLYG